MQASYSARSHVGMVRENNEDNLYIDGITLSPDTCSLPFEIDGAASPPAVFAVCDGMGGEENGETASLMAVQALLRFDGRLKSAAPAELDKTVPEYVAGAEAAVRTAGRGARSGTTLALVVASAHGAYCYNIGDSRIYCLRKSEFRQVTNDHTLAAMQLRAGVPPDRAVSRSFGNKLTRCIGIGDSAAVESYAPVAGECRMLICSDGLSDMVADAELERILRVSERTADAADALLQAALRGGGRDNVTLIVLDIKSAKRPGLWRFTKKRKGYNKV